MRMIWKLLSTLVLLLMFSICISVTAYSSQKQVVETEGSIGFTGKYTPVGSPDPTPNESDSKPPAIGVAKPEGTLPQTNDSVSSWLLWLGILITSFVLIYWKKGIKQIKN